MTFDLQESGHSHHTPITSENLGYLYEGFCSTVKPSLMYALVKKPSKKDTFSRKDKMPSFKEYTHTHTHTNTHNTYRISTSKMERSCHLHQQHFQTGEQTVYSLDVKTFPKCLSLGMAQGSTKKSRNKKMAYTHHNDAMTNPP